MAEAAEEEETEVGVTVVVVVLELSVEAVAAAKLGLESPASVLVFPKMQSPSPSSMLPCSNNHSIASITFLWGEIDLVVVINP